MSKIRPCHIFCSCLRALSHFCVSSLRMSCALKFLSHTAIRIIRDSCASHSFFISLCTLACSHFGPVRMRVFGCTKLCCVCAFAQVICCKYAAHRSSAEQVRFAFEGNTRLICNDTLISHHVLDLYTACLHRTYNAR